MVEKDVVEMEWRLDHAQSQIVLVITTHPFENKTKYFINNKIRFYDRQISFFYFQLIVNGTDSAHGLNVAPHAVKDSKDEGEP